MPARLVTQNGAHEAQWIGRYEDLRHQWLGSSSPSAGGWGMTLFLHSGLAAWMRAWPQTSPPREPRIDHVGGDPAWAPSLGQEVVMLLVNMLLGRRREAPI